IGDDFPQRLLRVDVRTVLVDIGDLDRFTDLQIAGVDFFQPNQGFEERGFSDTVWTANANNAVWWQREAEVINQGTTVKALGDVVGFDHLAAQAWTGWDLDFFEVQYTGFFGFGGHFFVAFQTSFLLGLATLGVGA